MRAPDPSTLPGVASSGTEPAPERRSDWTAPSDWTVWAAMAGALIVCVTGACLNAEADGLEPMETIGQVLGTAGAIAGFWTTRIFSSMVVRRQNEAEGSELRAAAAISMDEIDRVIMRGMVEPLKFVRHSRQCFDTHHDAGRLYEAQFRGRVIRRTGQVLDSGSG